jgi:hypothetical protein
MRDHRLNRHITQRSVKHKLAAVQRRVGRNCATLKRCNLEGGNKT